MKFLCPENNRSLFEPSLHLNLRSHDAEQMREQSVYWLFEHMQFGGGKCCGKITDYYQGPQ